MQKHHSHVTIKQEISVLTPAPGESSGFGVTALRCVISPFTRGFSGLGVNERLPPIAKPAVGDNDDL